MIIDTFGTLGLNSFTNPGFGIGPIATRTIRPLALGGGLWHSPVTATGVFGANPFVNVPLAAAALTHSPWGTNTVVPFAATPVPVVPWQTRFSPLPVPVPVSPWGWVFGF